MIGSEVSASPARRFRILLPLAAGILGAVSFVLLHALNYAKAITPIYERASAGTPTGVVGFTGAIVGFCLFSLAVYSGFALAGAAIAAKTKDRLVWMLPAALFVLSPIPAALILQDRPALRPILDLYDTPGSGPGAWRWAFALMDLALVLLPGAVVAFRAVRHRRQRADRSAQVAFAVCAALALLVYLRHRGLENGSFDVDISAHLTLGIAFIVGAALGIKRPWFPVVHVIVALCFSEALYVLLDWAFAVGDPVFSTMQRLDVIWHALIPPLTAVAIGALADPLSRYLRFRRERPSPSAQPA